ncbi:MAG TPA: regulatory protein RecX, partial [Patescibacteria group bacterium]
VVLYFDNNFIIPLFIDDYVRIQLKSGFDYDHEMLATIVNASLGFLLRDYSLRQIAMSPKTKTILSRKIKMKLNQLLSKYKVPQDLTPTSDLIDRELAYIESTGLIDNRQYIESYIRRHPQHSKALIIQGLRAQGVSVTPDELLGFDLGSNRLKIHRLLQKKRFSRELLSDPKSKNKILAFLARKGFSYDEIRSAIDDYLQNQ